MHRRWGERIAGIFFIILFAAAGALGLGAALSAAPAVAGFQAAGPSAEGTLGPSQRLGSGAGFKAAALSLATGSSQAAFQKRFDTMLALRPWAVAAVAEARWAIFGQGYPGVLIGRDSWLFSTEEFEDDLDYLDGDIAAFAKSADDRLKAKGVRLLILPVPAKARIYSGFLPAGLKPANEGRYATLLAAFSSLGIPALDLEEAFLSYDGSLDLFLRGDTHWSPEGALIAARLAAGAIKDLPEAQGFPKTDYRLRESGYAEHRGDLLAFLPARGVPWRPLPPPDSLAGLELLAEDTGGSLDAAALFGAQNISVALVGTSYSASAKWHFEDYLKAELSCDVLNLASEGEGPFKPLLDALDSPVLEENGARVLLWELPERYVPGDGGRE
jgi:alginate O-acetyltransferase complex protein AlgJ